MYPGPTIGQNADVELLVAADDRTGSTETAAALADAGAGDVSVVAWPATAAAEADAAVVDLGSRHLSPAAAADRAASVDAVTTAPRHAHKIDSTLRGNWAEELVARAHSRPVLLVPALPEHGRVCVDGVVLDHGRPVHEGNAGSDVRRRVVTSRPKNALQAAGAAEVHELAHLEHVVAWLGEPHGIAVADAADGASLAAIVQAWCAVDGVLLAGTSAVIGAAGVGEHEQSVFPRIDGPVLVVCGSVHPVARAQMMVAEHHGTIVTHLVDDLTIRALASSHAMILATEIPVGDVDEPLAVAAASSLARGVSDLAAHVPIGALVIIGGDTAAAVLGHADTLVHGSLEPGTPWMTVARLEMPVITRAGGFGSDHALIDLLRKMCP
jgi:4-hydroxythreonine-4-phosphate dehydrogenase